MSNILLSDYILINLDPTASTSILEYLASLERYLE